MFERAMKNKYQNSDGSFMKTYILCKKYIFMTKEKKYLKGELSRRDGSKTKQAGRLIKVRPCDLDKIVKDNLLSYLQSYLNYSPEFEVAILPMLTVRTLDKVERIVNQDEVSSAALWLHAGYGRWFVEHKDKEGLPVDVTIDFFRYGKILVSGEGFFNENPSLFNVELAAGSVVIDFPRHFYDALRLTAPEAETLAVKILATDRPEGLEKMNMVRRNTRDRYREFLRIFGPEIEQYFAVKHIASYLAMQPSYLSRIRAEHFKKITERKKYLQIVFFTTGLKQFWFIYH